MAAELTCEVEQVGTRLVVRLAGELCLDTAPRVRLTLLKCLVDQPDAIVLDLAALTITEPSTVAMFSAVARQAAMWPGTPLLLCAPRSEVAALLARRPKRLKVYPSVEDALTVEPAHQPVVSDMLLPVQGASRQARDVTVNACARWNVTHLSVPAGLIAAELVTNAAAHAGTMLDLRVTLGRRYLVIAVRDGSTSAPRLIELSPETLADPDTGRGLIIVDSIANRWGSIPVDGGKVVWATLRVHPSAAG